MINLNTTPQAILHLAVGEHATINDIEVIVNKSEADSQSRIYLTTADSRVQEYLALLIEDDFSDDINYAKYIKHVRHPKGHALMSRQELADVIVAGSYRIA